MRIAAVLLRAIATELRWRLLLRITLSPTVEQRFSFVYAAAGSGFTDRGPAVTASPSSSRRRWPLLALGGARRPATGPAVIAVSAGVVAFGDPLGGDLLAVGADYGVLLVRVAAALTPGPVRAGGRARGTGAPSGSGPCTRPA